MKQKMDNLGRNNVQCTQIGAILQRTKNSGCAPLNKRLNRRPNSRFQVGKLKAAIEDGDPELSTATAQPVSCTSLSKPSTKSLIQMLVSGWGSSEMMTFPRPDSVPVSGKASSPHKSVSPLKSFRSSPLNCFSSSSFESGAPPSISLSSSTSDLTNCYSRQTPALDSSSLSPSERSEISLVTDNCSKGTALGKLLSMDKSNDHDDYFYNYESGSSDRYSISSVDDNYPIRSLILRQEHTYELEVIRKQLITAQKATMAKPDAVATVNSRVQQSRDTSGVFVRSLKTNIKTALVGIQASTYRSMKLLENSLQSNY